MVQMGNGGHEVREWSEPAMLGDANKIGGHKEDWWIAYIVEPPQSRSALSRWGCLVSQRSIQT